MNTAASPRTQSTQPTRWRPVAGAALGRVRAPPGMRSPSSARARRELDRLEPCARRSRTRRPDRPGGSPASARGAAVETARRRATARRARRSAGPGGGAAVGAVAMLAQRRQRSRGARPGRRPVERRSIASSVSRGIQLPAEALEGRARARSAGPSVEVAAAASAGGGARPASRAIAARRGVRAATTRADPQGQALPPPATASSAPPRQPPRSEPPPALLRGGRARAPARGMRSRTRRRGAASRPAPRAGGRVEGDPADAAEVDLDPGMGVDSRGPRRGPRRTAGCPGAKPETTRLGIPTIRSISPIEPANCWQ